MNLFEFFYEFCHHSLRLFKQFLLIFRPFIRNGSSINRKFNSEIINVNIKLLDSSNKCNTCQIVEFFRVNLVRRFKTKSFSGSVIQNIFYIYYLSFCNLFKVGIFWKVLPYQTVKVFISSSLPTMIGLCEVEINIKSFCYLLMVGKFFSIIRSNSMYKRYPRLQ